MRLLLIALLAFVTSPAFAQSGTIVVPASLTNTEVNLTALIPPPNAGMTRLQVSVDTTFSQTLTVENPLPVAFDVRAQFCNVSRLDIGAIPIADYATRDSIEFDAAPGLTTGDASSVVSIGATYSLNQGGPLVLRNNVRCGVWTDAPPGDGWVVNTKGSLAASVFTFTYLP